MFKEGEKVNLNGKDYIIWNIKCSKGAKACKICTQINGKAPCIEAFDYPEKAGMFDLKECNKKVPEFCIPKKV